MNVRKQVRLGRAAWLAVMVLAAVLILGGGSISSQSAWAEDTGPRMVFNVIGDEASCDAASEPTSCELELGAAFTLSIDVVEFPEPSYTTMQTFVDYESLVYEPTEEADPEIIWPDAQGFQLRGEACPGCVNHGATTAVVPPFPESTHIGPVVQLAMRCSDAYSANEVRLIPYNSPPAATDGALFVTPDNSQIPSKADSLAVTCGEPPPPTEPGGEETPATATAAATTLPPTGDGGGVIDADDGANVGLWVAVGSVVAALAAALGFLAWRRVRIR